jgi:4-amino-4-deoxy-L-arabinose transferase-like glycosyltransferase
LLFLVPAVLIASPWFLATALVNPDFVVYFFWKHHVVRFSDAFNHRQPFWFYLPTIFIMMFPASYLFPSLFNFVASRKDVNRNLRTATHGSLLLTSAWIVGFFSISESKLPTYILPALPPLCLLMGVVLDKKIFSTVSSGWQSVRESGIVQQPFLERVPQRNVRELLFFILAILLACRLFLGATYLDWWMLVAGGLALVAVSYFSLRVTKRPVVQWYCAGLMSFCFVIVGVNQLAPQLAHVRSNHAAAKLLRTEPGMEDAPVVFFGRENYGAAMTFPKDKVFFYESEEADEVCGFLEEHPNSIIISSKKPMKNLRRMLSWTIWLDRLESGRHLYQSRPNPELIAHEPADTLIR